MKWQKENKHKLGKIGNMRTNCPYNCSYCYDKKALKQYPNTQLCADHNTDFMKSSKAIPMPPRSINRLYIGGDIRTIKEAKKLIAMANTYSDKTFYGYTKAWQNKKLLPYLETLRDLDNVILRASFDTITGTPPKSWTLAGVLEAKTLESFKQKFLICNFSNDKIKCDVCKKCFNKKLAKIAIFFPKH